MEIESALSELEKTKEDEEVFKVVGPILVKKSKGDLKKELEDKRDEINSRIKMIENSEKKIRDNAIKNQENLQKIMNNGSNEKMAE